MTMVLRFLDIRGCYDRHAGGGGVLDQDVADFDRSLYRDAVDVFHHIRDLILGDILACLAGDALFYASLYPDGRGDDAGGVGDFLSRVDLTALAGVTGNGKDPAAVKLDRDKSAHRTADTGQFSFFHSLTPSLFSR